jgi:hypothetical protein
LETDDAPYRLDLPSEIECRPQEVLIGDLFGDARLGQSDFVPRRGFIHRVLDTLPAHQRSTAEAGSSLFDATGGLKISERATLNSRSLHAEIPAFLLGHTIQTVVPMLPLEATPAGFARQSPAALALVGSSVAATRKMPATSDSNDACVRRNILESLCNSTILVK